MKSILEATWPIAALLLYGFILWRFFVFLAPHVEGTFWGTNLGGTLLFFLISAAIILLVDLCDKFLSKRRNSNQ